MAKEKSKGAAKTIVALSAIEHDGTKYAVGDEIDVSGEQADELVGCGAAKLKSGKADKTEGNDQQ